MHPIIERHVSPATSVGFLVTMGCDFMEPSGREIEHLTNFDLKWRLKVRVKG